MLLLLQARTHVTNMSWKRARTKGRTPIDPAALKDSTLKTNLRSRTAVINEDKEDQHSEAETSTTAPPSYTKKDILQYIRGMSIKDRETLYEEMSAQADF
jgi:hypothetical protein